MTGFWMDMRQFERPVATFQLGPGMLLPENRFENGVQVLVTRVDPLKEVPIRGSVFSRTPTQLQVSFPEMFDDLDSGQWRLDIGLHNMVYERMRTAISQLNQDPAEQEVYVTARNRQLILQGTHLRDVLLRSFSPALPAHQHVPVQAADDPSYVAHETLEHPSRMAGDMEGVFKDDMRIQSWARRYSLLNPVRIEGDPVLDGLNPTQVRAVAMMVGQRASLVQGPPGTGKTRTIIEAIQLLKVHFQVSFPILVCTYTNAAVDNLLAGLASAGVKPLRVGYSGKVEASLQEHNLEAKLESHHLRPELQKVTADKEVLQQRMRMLNEQIQKVQLAKRADLVRRLERMEAESVKLERQLRAVGRKVYALKQQMLTHIVEQADVVCTTCITSACMALRVVDFPVVFLDEASMSTEPASLIPIMKGSRHVALIGDHKQLPPVIVSREAQVRGLGISLFERLTEEGAVPTIMLDLQYRMHPAISRFPSSEFYNFSLLDGTVDASGKIPSHLHPPLSMHLPPHPTTGHTPSVVFLDHGGAESFKDRSRVNWTEAHIVCSVIEDLLLSNEGLGGEDIGVIAPYVAQIALLTRFLNVDAKYANRFKAVLGEQRAMQMGKVEVKTVDGFEGREKAIIVFSTVRNNAGGYIGFLADRRRLNVGLTRAKRGLFVVGSLATLRGSRRGVREAAGGRVGKGAEAWRRYAEFLTEEQLVVPVDNERLRAALRGPAYGQARPVGRVV
ncbi:P-loop containing nucleoside triphosphate hydrolase protein [Dentipellis sp. KUC8613]|nr:P-loop containing nucleoside triphosphate hydrolase protein [Dentipellis sp. KUC8613]